MLKIVSRREKAYYEHQMEYLQEGQSLVFAASSHVVADRESCFGFQLFVLGKRKLVDASDYLGRVWNRQGDRDI